MNAAIRLLLPLVIVAFTVVLVIVSLSIRRSHRFTHRLTLLGIVAAFVATWVAEPAGTDLVGPLFVVDAFTRFYQALLLAAAFAIALISFDYLEGREENKGEYYVLLLSATLGALVIVGSRHFVSFFLGLEILSVSLYPLIAYLRTSERFSEAGLKYLVLSGASSAFLLFGMALVYGTTGTMDFSLMVDRLKEPAGGWLLAGPGLALTIVGIGFKLGLVPFHMWTPDVYQGAPAPVAAFIATVSKGAMFGILMRLFPSAGILDHPRLFLVFAIIATASMFAGNLLALFQNSIKRILAYSSIAHFGYLLVAFLSAGALRTTSVTFYLVAYFVMIIGAFTVVTLLSPKRWDADDVPGYAGLFERRPWLAATFTLMLLSLAGMPLTAGFVAKIYVVAAGLSSLLGVLVVILIVNSAISLFYYLRVVVTLFRPSPLGEPFLASAVPKGRALLVVLFFLLVWWGIYPIPLISLIERIRMTVP